MRSCWSPAAQHGSSIELHLGCIRVNRYIKRGGGLDTAKHHLYISSSGIGELFQLMFSTAISTSNALRGACQEKISEMKGVDKKIVAKEEEPH